MSAWTHLVCEDCWNQLEPCRTPARVTNSTIEPCCKCGKDTDSGIFVRGAVERFECNGNGVVHS